MKRKALPAHDYANHPLIENVDLGRIVQMLTSV
jgi:hypothetical protein